MNLIVGFQGRVRNARGQMGAWGGTLDGNGRLEDGWTQESVLRVERMLLLTSTVKAWDRTRSVDSGCSEGQLLALVGWISEC